MKYSEFDNELAELEMIPQHFESAVYVIRNGVSVGKVSRESRYMMSTTYDSFAKIPEMDAVRLFAAMAMLSETPLADREEEKRYYLRLITPPIIKKQVQEYLVYSEYLECYTTSLNKNVGTGIKTIFTESEIAQMDITGFEKVEVSE